MTARWFPEPTGTRRGAGLSRRQVGLILTAAVLVGGCRGCGTQGKPVAEDRFQKDQSRSTIMTTTTPRFTLASPGLVTSYQVGPLTQWAAYGVAAIGSKHLLQTKEYYEGGREYGEVESLKPASWDVEVPGGAELFGATSGITPGNARQFWVGWLVGRHLHMQALMQEQPIDGELADNERAILPPVMDKSGAAALYSWRPVGGGAALWRHVFTGPLKGKGTVATEALSEIPSHPVISIAGAVPGDPTQHAVIGWAEDTEAGVVLGIAIVRPTRMRVVRSEPMPGFVVAVRQRPGIWASAPPAGERYELTVALEGRVKPPYAAARFSVGAKEDERSTSVAPIDLPPGSLHSAAFDYLKNCVDPKVTRTYLTTDGQLWFGDPPKVRRQGVPLDDPLPVLTTRKVYWGVRGPDGFLAFESF